MSTGIRCMLMRGGTSKGAYFLAGDLPADPAARDDLLIRVMGSGDPRQIDGIGGAHPLTSKVAVVSRSADDQADLDYLFLQLGVDQATVSDQQNCGNLLAGVGPFAVERGLIAAGPEQTTTRIRMVNSGSLATAQFATPGGVPDYDGDTGISGVPGHGERHRARLHRHGGLGHRCAAAHRPPPRRDRRDRGHLRRQRHAGGGGPGRRPRADRVRKPRGARRQPRPWPTGSPRSGSRPGS